MSMLAERKQKQKWSLNPRGKHWSEDVNKFGHKMLEKMGWSAGKGLGANEDGMTEHIKISYKNDSKGMGFQDNGEQWTKHEDNFTSLLANLGAGDEATQITLPKPEKSLEKKSQSSRARVHYHKFTRGKDLATRSEKDIANIFGRKTLERSAGPKETQDTIENETEDKSFGVVTIKAGNMTDYFKSKLGKIGHFSSSKGDYSLNENESDIGVCTGFGFTSANEEKYDTPSIENNKINFVASQNSKNEETPVEEEVKNNKRKGNDVEEWTEVVPKKKKKSKKKELAFDNLGNDINPAEEVCYDNPCLKQIDSPEQNENNDEKTKIKKRVTFSSPITEVLNKSDESNKTEKSKKKKKNKHLTNGIDNLGCEEKSFEEPNQLSNEENGKKSKKKKKRSMDNNENSENISPIKKKKKHEEVGIDNLACEEISINEKNEEIKRYKLKKKAMEYGLVNPVCETNNDPENEIDNLGCEEDTKVQKKKNKKQKNKNENSFDISNENVSENDDIAKTKKNKKKKKITEEDNIESPSKKLKKKSKNKENGIENLGCEINTVEENIASINNEMDNYQTELENEINVKKIKKQKKRLTQSSEDISNNGRNENSPNNKSKNDTVDNLEQSTNNEKQFQDNNNLSGDENSGQKIEINKFENTDNHFGNSRNNFKDRNNHFNPHQNMYRNGSFTDQRSPNNFNSGQRGPNNFNRSYDNYGNPNYFNRSFDGQRSMHHFNNQDFNDFNRRRGPNYFNNQTNPRIKRFNPDRVDKSSLKYILKPGELKLRFTGSNLMKLAGYGVATELINANNRPKSSTKTS